MIMKTDIKKLREKATITLNRLEEDDLPEDVLEGGIGDLILEEFKCNEWAWFCAEVIASYAGVESEPQYLGCCSYKDEPDFKSDSYYSQLVEDAIESLVENLDGIIKDLKEVKMDPTIQNGQWICSDCANYIVDGSLPSSPSQAEHLELIFTRYYEESVEYSIDTGSIEYSDDECDCCGSNKPGPRFSAVYKDFLK